MGTEGEEILQPFLKYNSDHSNLHKFSLFSICQFNFFDLFDFFNLWQKHDGWNRTEKLIQSHYFRVIFASRMKDQKKIGKSLEQKPQNSNNRNVSE